MGKVAASKPKSRFESWQDYINDAVANPAKWNAYDCDIQTAVSEYNQHLSGVAGYMPLNWQFIKAMTWVETGAGKPEWRTSPIQIGNPGDPGLAALLNGKDGGDMILPPSLKGTLNAIKATTIPSYNIRAGIGYLLMRMANFAIKNVPDADTKVYEVTIKSGDSLDLLARAHGSTVETLKELNPNAKILRPGQVLKYQKASMQKVIVGWKALTTNNIAFYYNVGDSSYAKKLDYALSLIRSGKAAVCKP